MNQYKVIGNSCPKHCFAIGSIVTLVGAKNDEWNAMFQCISTKLQQFVKMADVELVKISLQEAEANLEAVVAEIYQKISEAES